MIHTKHRPKDTHQTMYDRFGNRLGRSEGQELDCEITGPKQYPPGGPCLHLRWGPSCSGILNVYGEKSTHPYAYHYGQSNYNWIDPLATTFVWTPYVNSLNWRKLSTSNQAGLLQTLAELDDTVAMFGKKLLTSLSYGGYKWGWAPLLSDVASVNDVVTKTAKYPPGLPQPYDDTNTFTKIWFTGKSDQPGTRKITWDVTVRHKGRVSFDYNLLSYYDFLGFHPSPKLIWDLVPLSFAVDWVLPISDMLDNIQGPQGWVQAVSFEGWRHIKAVYRESIVKNRADISYVQNPPKFTYYSRNYIVGSLETKTHRKEVGLKWPTFSNVLDYAYLAKTFATRK